MGYQCGVGLIGADGVGKTTLINALKDHYGPRISIISGVSRKIIKDGYPLGKAAKASSYIALITAHMNEESRAICGDRPFVSERTHLDAYCYSLTNQELYGAPVSQDVIELNKAVWLRSLSCYELFIYLPIEFGIVADGTRENDADYQLAIDRNLSKIGSESGIHMSRVSGTVEDRLKQSIELIESRNLWCNS